MIEKTILNHLKYRLPVPVYTEIPPDPPARFVVFRKADSSRENYIDTAMFVINSHAESLYEAARLNEQVKTAMDSLTELSDVSCCKLSTDYNFTDTASKCYRYQAVFDVTHY